MKVLILSAMQTEILLERKNKTYRAGEYIRGFVDVTNAPVGVVFRSLQVTLEGILKSQGKGEASEVIPQIPPVTLCRNIEIVAADKRFTENSMKFPFEVQIIPQRGQLLLETYNGVFILIQYKVKAAFEGLNTGKTSGKHSKGVKVAVQVPNLGLFGRSSREKRVHTFEILPSLVEVTSKISIIPEFRIEGELDSDLCHLDEEFNGWISVSYSDREIKSIELQLIRVESLIGKTGSFNEKSEVQSLQIADGNVRKQLQIPLYMLLPKQFSCPTTVYGQFKIEFAVNIIVLFIDGLQVLKSIPIHLIR